MYILLAEGEENTKLETLAEARTAFDAFVAEHPERLAGVMVMGADTFPLHHNGLEERQGGEPR